MAKAKKVSVSNMPGCEDGKCVHVIQSSKKHVDFDQLSKFESVAITLVALLAITVGVVYATMLLA